VRALKSVRAILPASVMGVLGCVHAQAADQGAAPKTSALPADIDPESGNRLPLPKREDMNGADQKIFDDIMARQQGGLSSREKERPQVRMYSPGLSKGLEEAHHYLKYDTGLGDRLMTSAVLTTARELTPASCQCEESLKIADRLRRPPGKRLDEVPGGCFRAASRTEIASDFLRL